MLRMFELLARVHNTSRSLHKCCVIYVYILRIF